MYSNDKIFLNYCVKFEYEKRKHKIKNMIQKN